jgi:hypothetical protein
MSYGHLPRDDLLAVNVQTSDTGHWLLTRFYDIYFHALNMSDCRAPQGRQISESCVRGSPTTGEKSEMKLFAGRTPWKIDTPVFRYLLPFGGKTSGALIAKSSCRTWSDKLIGLLPMA